MIRKREIIELLVIFIILILLVILRIISQHFQINLPGRYLFYNSSYGVIIENKDAIKYFNEKHYIGPSIGGYHVYSNIVAGQITKHRNSDEFSAIYSQEGYERRLGYFIIDLHTKKVYGGLSKEEWIKKLKKYNVNEEPKLYKPSFLDGYLGRNMP